jgi:post-segregation antitoxin (ccd killing protein)
MSDGPDSKTRVGRPTRTKELPQPVIVETPAPDRPAGGAPLRLVSVPAADPYVDAVRPAGVVGISPVGAVTGWPDRAWLAENAAGIDVLHVHAGRAGLPDEALDCWGETVRRSGIALVVTVHQLRDPVRPLSSHYGAALAALLATAEVVFTLTTGAADEIADRYGRTAIVVAHPSVVVPDPEVGAERGLVGLRLGPASLAVPNPAGLVRAALSGAVSGGGRLRVLVSSVDESRLSREVLALAGRGDIELIVHPAEEWAAQVQQLHVVVLPERYGTHSVDVEIARDVGTRVVAPSCGCFVDQWSDVVAYGNDEDGGLDPVSLTAAVSAALTRPMPRPADRLWRAEQREAIRRVHAEVYAQVAGDRRWENA